MMPLQVELQREREGHGGRSDGTCESGKAELSTGSPGFTSRRWSLGHDDHEE
ncbi:hypothetical protein [Bacillus velezensis]|uniref:hypothetical protein n=1 Tax=Bacillus velezensis TaxID=492670 RepID=UPI003EBA6AAB